MCYECLRTFCPPSCPNFVEYKVFDCDGCGNEIYEGDTYYRVGEDKYCEDCINGMKETAEFEEPEDDD